ncbi:MAG: amino acid adenylation domain-containing protein [Gemmatimonadota bacterium]
MTAGTHNLSAGQRALWLLQRIEPESPSYNVVRAIRIRGPLDETVARRAWERIVQRHAVLRSTVQVVDGRPVVVVQPNASMDFAREDASGWSDEALRQRLISEVRRPFDLSRERPMRVRVLSVADDDHIGVMSMHHAVTDMWSLAILTFEFAAFYEAELGDSPAPASREPTAYAEFVSLQEQLLSSPRGAALRDFWMSRIAGGPPLLEITPDRARPPSRAGRCHVHPWTLDGELVARASDLAARLGSNLPTLLTSVFQVLLGRYSGEEDIVVGSPQAGRSGRFAATVGYFVNPVPLRADLSGDPPFDEFLRRNDESVRSSRDHADFPFPLLVEHMKPDRPAGRSPVFEICFSWQKTTRLLPLPGFLSLALHHEERTISIGGNECWSYPLPEQAGPFDFVLLMAQEGDHVKACFEYDPDLFTESTIRRIRAHYLSLLESVLADPHRRLTELALMSGEEEAAILDGWSRAPVREPEAACLHQLFERQAVRVPGRIAVDGPSIAGGVVRLTYGELEERSNRLAHHLRRLGVGPGTNVVLFLERSPEMATAVLGTLKAGAGFVPVDASQPVGRLEHIVRDTAAPVLVTQRSLRSSIRSPAGTRLLCLDEDAERIASESGARVPSEVGPLDIAYVIYTSGSTGAPKGVLLEHAGAVNLVSEQVRGFGLAETDRVLQFASPSFDAAVSELFMALASGAAAVFAPRESLLPGPPLLDLIRRDNVSVITLPPSVLGLLPPQGLSSLRAVISAGEACPWTVARRWADGRRFFNAYGPTEATIGPTYFEVTASVPDAGSLTVPVGRPIANVNAYVLDGRMRPAPAGVPGELWLGGVCVARGYLGHPDLTHERFVADPFGAPGDRLYRTGDRVRWLADGTLEFLGRYDAQLKIRGFRIEPAEIETAIESHPAIRKAAVVGRRDGHGSQQLLAYVALDPKGAEPASGSVWEELREHLRVRLPNYMLPSGWMRLDEIPLTASGKVDRRSLPAFRPEPSRADAKLVRPHSEIERAVASIWEEALGIEGIGAQENFFDIGGHSLLALTVHDRLEEEFGEEFPVVEMFRYPTISALADFLRRNGASRSRHRGRELGALQKSALDRSRARSVVRSGRSSGAEGDGEND